ncbi:MAG: AI-2E family transporter [Rhodobacteraceae bacterium]|nr:AI-2E family transporter [Paracoccaceae bacterium]
MNDHAKLPKAHDGEPNGGAIIDAARIQSAALVLIAFAVVLFLLVQARFLLISLATAIILFSLTSNAINFIARQKIGKIWVPNWLASTAAVTVIAAVLLTITSILLAQVNSVLVTTLSYAERAPAAIAALFAWLGDDAQTAVFNSVRSIDLSGYLRTVAGQASSLMQAAVLVILFVGFLFAERVWFSIKLVNLVGGNEKAARVEVIVETIINKVNHYLLVKTLVSLVTGIMVWGVAELFGLDLAAALGILTFVLNFIPSVGSIIATGLVTLVAYVQMGAEPATLLIFLLVTVIQFINGNIIDPTLMGRALRMSSFGIILSLAFWSAVWGIPGMFLSVPIMVALMIVCSQVPELRPLAILLSREGLPEPEHPPKSAQADPQSGPVLRPAPEDARKVDEL